jgi:hypothetical protein
VPLHDLGYRRWNGELSPPTVRWWVIAETGVRLAWRSRWLRRMLALAWLPAVVAAVCFFIVENALSQSPNVAHAVATLGQDFPMIRRLAQEIASDPEHARASLWSVLLLTFFRIPQGVLIIMLIALIAPPLIAQDLRSRAFLLYFSRPITRMEYVFGKMVTVAAYLSMITIVPGITLYLLGVGLSPDMSVVWDTWDLPFRVVAASIVVMVPTITFSLCLSAAMAESRFATFCWFTPWVVGVAAFFALTLTNDFQAIQRDDNPFTVSSKWSWLSPYHALGEVEGWIFGLEKDFSKVAPEAFMLSVVTLMSMAVLLRKVSSPMRV